MKRKFTIDLEFDNISGRISQTIAKAHIDLYGGGSSELEAGGAQSLLEKLPAVIYKKSSELVKVYAEIIQGKDIDAIHKYIDSQQKYIEKITKPDILPPSNGFMYIEGEQVSIDGLYHENYKQYIGEFRRKLKATHQRIDNEFLRLRKKRRYEVWIPVVVSSALSVVAIIVSIVSLGVKNG